MFAHRILVRLSFVCIGMVVASSTIGVCQADSLDMDSRELLVQENLSFELIEERIEVLSRKARDFGYLVVQGTFFKEDPLFYNSNKTARYMSLKKIDEIREKFLQDLFGLRRDIILLGSSAGLSHLEIRSVGEAISDYRDLLSEVNLAYIRRRIEFLRADIYLLPAHKILEAAIPYPIELLSRFEASQHRFFLMTVLAYRSRSFATLSMVDTALLEKKLNTVAEARILMRLIGLGEISGYNEEMKKLISDIVHLDNDSEKAKDFLVAHWEIMNISKESVLDRQDGLHSESSVFDRSIAASKTFLSESAVQGVKSFLGFEAFNFAEKKMSKEEFLAYIYR